jgi:hypothetical protein
MRLSIEEIVGIISVLFGIPPILLIFWNSRERRNSLTPRQDLEGVVCGGLINNYYAGHD